MSVRNLDALLRPRSVAVIGASDEESSADSTLMRNLLQGRFQGPILPVNQQRRSVAGVHAYRCVAHLPLTPDLALLCTPPSTVPGLVQELGRRGTRAVVVFANGLSATLEKAEPAWQHAALAAARPHMLRILGPNSVGLINPGVGLNASTVSTPALPGRVAFVSQSGALSAAALDWAGERNIGFSHVVSLGDAADVDAADVIDYLGSDLQTRAVLLYLESVKAGRRFLSAARAASRNKPLIVLKSGRTEAGAQAVMRHTGSPPGDDGVFDAAVSRAGMLRVATVAELFAASETLAGARWRRGEKLVILSNAGGPGVIAADALAQNGGELGALAPGSVEALARVLPADAAIANPLDLGGEATAARYGDSLGILLAAPGEDAVLIIHGPSAAAPGEETAAVCAGAGLETQRNVLACWMGCNPAQSPVRRLREAGIPVYATPEDAVQGYLQVLRLRRNQESLQEVPAAMPAEVATDAAAARELVRRALSARRESLPELDAKALIASYGIPVAETHRAASADEAVRLAAQTGYPVALKVLSPDIEHRVDVGGVMLNLEDESEVRAAAMAIERRMHRLRPGARLSGFTVQRMIRPPGALAPRHGAHELALSAAEDPVFGPVVRLRVCATGASVAEALALLPLNSALARDMLARSGLASILAGTHERPGADLSALCTALTRVSRIFTEYPEVRQLDIDPLLIDGKGVVAVEVRVRIGLPRGRASERFAIPPYPSELEQALDFQFRGLPCLLRPIRPEDAQAFSEFIGRTDAPDLRLRFVTLTRSVPAQDLARYTQIDYDREMAFVAVIDPAQGGCEILGEVRLFFYPGSETGEFGLLVRSDVKRRGLGRALLAKAIDYCRSIGMADLIGQVAPENQPMLALARSVGMDVESRAGASLAVVHMDLRQK
ncbi:MAG: bifunctional acetate--CoA ligase family protein/GNAT family N-acetyltransferase [Burkholderiales bacterium]|nr:bifunctional acetate--CoA ligase family protein/GNAT family N-acetyltransferase [Burkholderiales bacterium]